MFIVRILEHTDKQNEESKKSALISFFLFNYSNSVVLIVSDTFYWRAGDDVQQIKCTL